MNKYTDLTDTQARAMNFIFSEYSEDAYENITSDEPFMDDTTLECEIYEQITLSGIKDTVLGLVNAFDEVKESGYEEGYNDSRVEHEAKEINSPND